MAWSDVKNKAQDNKEDLAELKKETSEEKG